MQCQKVTTSALPSLSLYIKLENDRLVCHNLTHTQHTSKSTKRKKIFETGKLVFLRKLFCISENPIKTS